MNVKLLTAALATPALLAGTQAHAALLAEDDLTTSPQYLSDVSTGFGWGNDWNVQNFPSNYDSNDDGEADLPGYEVRNADPLSYGLLQNSDTYAVGGRRYENSARALNTSTFTDEANPFRDAGYIVDNDDDAWTDNWIGASGETLYVSFLADANANASFFSLSTGGGWVPSDKQVSVSVVDDVWTLVNQVDSESAATSVSAVDDANGGDDFLVLRIDFGDESDTLSLYANPTLGAEPLTADATLDASDLQIRRIHWKPGNDVGDGQIDAIRFGETFADVTPVVPEPASLGLLAAGSLLMLRRRSA